MNIVNPNNNSLNSKYYNITLFDEINAESTYTLSNEEKEAIKRAVEIK